MLPGLMSRCTMPAACAASSAAAICRAISTISGVVSARRAMCSLRLSPSHALHRDESRPLVFVDLVDRADVGVIETGQRLGFALQAPGGVGVTGQLLGQELQGHRPREPQVLAVVDHSHPPDSELARNPVVRNGGADHDGGGYRCLNLLVRKGSVVINSIGDTDAVTSGGRYDADSSRHGRPETRKASTAARTSAHIDPLLSDEPTMELVIRAREGDRMAVEALLQRCLPVVEALGTWPAAGGRAGLARYGRSGAGSGAARACGASMCSSRGTLARCRRICASR